MILKCFCYTCLMSLVRFTNHKEISAKYLLLSRMMGIEYKTILIFYSTIGVILVFCVIIIILFLSQKGGLVLDFCLDSVKGSFLFYGVSLVFY